MVSIYDTNLIKKIKDFQKTTELFDAQKTLRNKQNRQGMMTIFKNHNIGEFETKWRLKDIISFALKWKHADFDENFIWQCELIRFMLGFVTQQEEDWLKTEADKFYQEMIRRSSKAIDYSKAFVSLLRHNQTRRNLFDKRGMMEINTIFDVMRFENPVTSVMTGRQFAAFLLGNPKGRFHLDVYVGDQWSIQGGAIYPFEIRMGATQGHSNSVVELERANHTLTFDEARSLGWIFHATDISNAPGIERDGLQPMGRDAVHFMYHNDNANGYISMGPGTQAARFSHNPVYYVLKPQFYTENKLFLTPNGVVLVNKTVPPRFLIRCEQLPTVAMNVLHRSLGHVLPQTVSMGTWPANTSSERIAGEEGIPESSVSRRQTAWEFMGGTTPSTYLRLVFPGRSTEVEEPASSSARASGSSKDVAMHDETEDPIEEVNPPSLDDMFVDQATSSFARINPWILYEANINVAEDPRNRGEVLRNSSGEKVVTLIEWNKLATNQRRGRRLRGQVTSVTFSPEHGNLVDCVRTTCVNVNMMKHNRLCKIMVQMDLTGCVVKNFQIGGMIGMS